MAVRSGFFLVVNLKRISGGRKGSFSLNSSGPNGHDPKHLQGKKMSQVTKVDEDRKITKQKKSVGVTCGTLLQEVLEQT
jgi:hypothetical protein